MRVSSPPGRAHLQSVAWHIILPTVLAVIWAGITSTSIARAEKQHSPQNSVWDPPRSLFETEGRASEPVVIADPSGAVHVFWAYGAPDAEEEGWAQAIYHASQQDGAWSEPVDVLISPGGRVARTHSVAADSRGYLHIVWSGGDTIFYSRAFAPEAGAAGAWGPPEAFVSGIVALEPAIAVGPDDALYAVWTQARSGLMFVRSDDGGESWSTPQAIYRADSNNELARWGRIAVDETGRIHVVLTYTIDDPEARYGRRDANLLYYLRSDDGGATWGEPFLVTPEPDFGQINVVTQGEDVVHLVWNGRAGRHGRYHRWSQDGGETWSAIGEVIAPAPANPLGNGGLTGFPGLAVDGTGALHMVTTAEQGNFYLRWQDGNWSSPLLISGAVDGYGVTRSNPTLEGPQLAISEGNRLHVVFQDGTERIWYTSTTVDAPYEAPQALPTPTTAAIATALVAPTAIATANPQPTPTLGPPIQAASQDTTSTFIPLLIGIAPAVLLVGAVVLWASTRRRR